MSAVRRIEPRTGKRAGYLDLESYSLTILLFLTMILKPALASLDSQSESLCKDRIPRLLYLFKSRSVPRIQTTEPEIQVMAESIRNLPQLLADYLGPTKTIKDQKITHLTTSGDNYGSLMLKVDITVHNIETEQEGVVHLVAKKIPANERIQEMFDIQVTFKKEVAFYENIIPALQEFKREMGSTRVIDCFPKSCGARFNIDNSDLVDLDAVLVLENLMSSGFSTTDRRKGFDLEGSKTVLKDLAEFHSVSLALKLKKPEQFNQNIKRYCHDFNFSNGPEEMFRDRLRNILLENENCAEVADRIHYLGEIKRPAAREPFATLIHFDLWVNNIMQKLVDGTVVVNKFVDFQLYTYGSPAVDLFFFLWSSVQQKVIENHLDDLMRYYHGLFIQNLSDLQCDTEPFGYDSLMEEMRLETEFEFAHALSFSTFIVGAEKSTENDYDNGILKSKDEQKKEISLEVKKKAWYMTEECKKRGWLGIIL